jgi:hypothetical protein
MPMNSIPARPARTPRAQAGLTLTRVLVILAQLLAGMTGTNTPVSAANTQATNAATVATADAGVISGVTFQDYNADGVMNLTANDTSPQIDRPIAGVTITAYDALGAVAGTAASGADGRYALNASGAGPYRIEFSAPPAGFVFGRRAVPSNASGGGAQPNFAGSSVQFVDSAPASNINVALIKPAEYCQDNPILASVCFGQGNPASGSHKSIAITARRLAPRRMSNTRLISRAVALTNPAARSG